MAREEDDIDNRDDDRPRPRRASGGGGEMGPLDKMYRDTNIVILILFGVCCGLIAFVLSLICYFTAKDETAKKNAMLVAIIGGVMMVVGVVLQVAGVVGGMAAR